MINGPFDTAKNMRTIIIICIVAICSYDTHASDLATHWMVTETGLIEPRTDSPFVMARSYDLLAFLNQDTLWVNIIKDYHNLEKQQIIIDQLWSDFENITDIDKHMLHNKSCIKAGNLKLIDWYTFLLEESSTKNIAEQDLLFNLEDGNGLDTDVPDCKKISSLTFSMSAFEHLEAMRNRNSLTVTPEESLINHISQIMTDNQFGHSITGSLKQNSSSWLHYKFAAMYWIMKGNAPKALECCRRALHYVPRAYRDIALVALGTVLHRSKATDDAITVLSAAVDHDPYHHMNHFFLANAYAVAGNFNSSVQHYEKCLKINPKFEIAKKYRNAVLCHDLVHQIMNSTRSTIKNLLQLLTDYLVKETKWLNAQATLLKSMHHKEEYDYTDVERNCIKISELTNLDVKSMKRKGDRNSLIKYYFEAPMYEMFWEEATGVDVLKSFYNIQKFVKHVSKHSKMVLELEGQQNSFTTADYILVRTHMHSTLLHEDVADLSLFAETYKEPTLDPVSKFEYETGALLFPPYMQISRNIEDFDKESDWPTDMFCFNTATTFPNNVEAIYPVFLPFENKGILLSTLLTDSIGVKVSEEHELPWHPPSCPQVKAVAAYTQKKMHKQSPIGEVVPTPYLRNKLLEYISNGNVEAVAKMQDAEIGQRIYSAMQKNLVPPWIPLTLASLYWRVRGNNHNALHCLASAAKTVDAQYKDIVMTSQASVYLEMGYFDEALAAAEEAFRLNSYEPATNFLLSELNMIKKHRNTHMFHLKQVVRVDGLFMDELARRLLNAWACVLKQVDKIQEKAEYAIGDICTPIEPGVNMVCEQDGTNCQMTHKKCQNNEKESSKVKMLSLNDVRSDTKTEKDNQFGSFIENMPIDRHDMAGHYINFMDLMKKVDGTLLGCGLRGCKSMTAKDLDMTEEDCSLQYIQLGYWLQIVTFKELFTNKEFPLPSDITALPSSNKRAPECEITFDVEADFFLERIYRVDTNNWEPIMSLMHQFAEMFNYFDFMSLGSKIQTYIELKPQSPLGLVLAGWWCAAAGRGECTRRCLAAAHAHHTPTAATVALKPLVAALLLQSKREDAKDIAYLAFYSSPNGRDEAFLVAISHSYMSEYEQAVWMYRYSLTIDGQFLPSKACLHTSLCLMIFGDKKKI